MSVGRPGGAPATTAGRARGYHLDLSGGAAAERGERDRTVRAYEVRTPIASALQLLDLLSCLDYLHAPSYTEDGSCDRHAVSASRDPCQHEAKQP